MALWVLAGFWVYKVVVIGSIYGLIKFIVTKLHSWLTMPKNELVNVRRMLDKHAMADCVDDLIVEIKRAKRATGNFIHDSDVAWLRDAISEKIAREKK